MISTWAQKRKGQMQSSESEVEHEHIENLEKSNKKAVRQEKSETYQDKDIEEPIEQSGSRKDLPFHDVPELEMTPMGQIEQNHQRTHLEPEKHIPAFKTRAPVEELELDDLLD